LGLVLMLSTLSGSAAACPVCFSAKNEQNRIAFIATTVFLSLLPLALIGGGVVWLRRRARNQVKDDPRRPVLAEHRRQRGLTARRRPLVGSFEDIPPTG
jgi:hypothetical protein